VGLSIEETNVICFLRKTNSIRFNYNIGGILILRSGCVEDLGVMLHSELYSHQRSNWTSSDAPQFLGFILFVTIHFSFWDSLQVSYITLISSKLENVSIARNNLTLQIRIISKNTLKLQTIVRVYIRSA
jgi:hypothetical protein